MTGQLKKGTLIRAECSYDTGIEGVVGEGGPEVIVPDQPGTVIPNPDTTNEVTDPELLKQLNSMRAGVAEEEEVSDPDLIAKLEAKRKKDWL